MHAFITSRLNYYSSLHVGLSNTLISRLQHDHILPIPELLHEFSVKYQISFRILHLTYKCRMDVLLYTVPLDPLICISWQFQIPDWRIQQAFFIAAPKLWNLSPFSDSVKSHLNPVPTALCHFPQNISFTSFTLLSHCYLLL